MHESKSLGIVYGSNVDKSLAIWIKVHVRNTNIEI